MPHIKFEANQSIHCRGDSVWTKSLQQWCRRITVQLVLAQSLRIAKRFRRAKNGVKQMPHIQPTFTCVMNAIFNTLNISNNIYVTMLPCQHTTSPTHVQSVDHRFYPCPGPVRIPPLLWITSQNLLYCPCPTVNISSPLPLSSQNTTSLPMLSQ